MPNKTTDTPETPILYSFRRCPFAMRGRMGLYAAGLNPEVREIILRAKPAHMLEISPKGTVPVLWLEDGSIIDESLDVMLYALGKSDPRNWLKNKKEALDLISEFKKSIKAEFGNNHSIHAIIIPEKREIRKSSDTGVPYALINDSSSGIGSLSGSLTKNPFQKIADYVISKLGERND